MQRDFWMNSPGTAKQRLRFSGSLLSSLFILLGICMGWVPFNMILLFNIWTRSSIPTFHHTNLSVCVCIHLNIKLTKNLMELFFFLEKPCQRAKRARRNAQSTPKMFVSSIWMFYLQFSKMCVLSPSILLDISLVCKGNKPNLHSWF